MPREITETWKCDLCGAPNNVTKDGKRGWVSISVEDRHADRMYHEKIVCSSCISLIKRSQDKEVS